MDEVSIINSKEDNKNNKNSFIDEFDIKYIN